MINNLVKAFILFLFIDSIYLSIVSKYYSQMILKIQSSKMNVNIFYAIITYLLIYFSWYYFIYKDLNTNNLNKQQNILKAFILGFCIYGIFDFTNLAIIKDWNLILALQDTIWGGILYSLVTYFTLYI